MPEDVPDRPELFGVRNDHIVTAHDRVSPSQKPEPEIGVLSEIDIEPQIAIGGIESPSFRKTSRRIKRLQGRNPGLSPLSRTRSAVEFIRFVLPSTAAASGRVKYRKAHSSQRRSATTSSSVKAMTAPPVFLAPAFLAAEGPACARERHRSRNRERAAKASTSSRVPSDEPSSTMTTSTLDR